MTSIHRFRKAITSLLPDGHLQPDRLTNRRRRDTSEVAAEEYRHVRRFRRERGELRPLLLG